MGASTGPEAIGGRIEVRLENGLQHELQSHLHQSVSERRDAKRAQLVRSARLGDEPLPYRFRTVAAAPKLPADLCEEHRHATGPFFDLTPRDAIRAWCLAAPIAGHPFPGLFQRPAIAYDIEQIHEDLVGLRGTPPVKLALHVEDERGIHRAGRHPSTSCWKALPTIPLRHVSGFSALGLLRGFRPSRRRSSVASIISRR